MLGCCFVKKKREEVKGKKKNPENYENRVRQYQQEIDEDANSSIVTSGAGPRDNTIVRNNPFEGRKKKNVKDESVPRNSPNSDDKFEDLSKSSGQERSSHGNQGGTVTYNITGKYIQFGKNSTIKKYNITNEKKKKKQDSSEKDTGSRPKDAPLYKCSTKSNVTNELTNPFKKWPSKIFTQPSQGNFKAQFDRTDNVYNQRLLVNLAISIGIIKSPLTCGTGFRVGRNFVMTAKHVIDGILNGGPVPFGQQEQSKHNLLRCPNVYIDFSYELPNCLADENSIFFFEEIVFENQDLDVAVLRLQSSGNSYPPAIINFNRLEQMDGDLYFIGHSRADIKKMDKFSCVSLPSDLQVPAGVPAGYEGVNNPRCQLLHCTFEKGASGAPGVWICPFDHMPYVVLMLIRGYPDWYYDEKTPMEKKLAMNPQVDCVEQGVHMEEIYKEMMKINPSLHSEIFNYKLAELPTPSYDDVEMKSQENC